jgi:L-seryl-tRNA(Ser) seleniumtransferase
MLTAPENELRERAAAIARAANGTSDAKVEVVAMESVTGGGSAPGMGVPSWGVGILHPERGADELDAALRAGDPPVIARIDNDRVMLDMRTVPVADDDRLAEAVIAALRRGNRGDA